MRLRVLIVAVLGVSVALVGGCGGSREAAAPAPAPVATSPATAPVDDVAQSAAASDEDLVRGVAEAYWSSYLAGDGVRVCGLMTDEARTSVGGDCAESVAIASDFLRVALGDGARVDLGAVGVTGVRARANFTIVAPNSTTGSAEEDGVLLLRKVGGEWLVEGDI